MSQCNESKWGRPVFKLVASAAIIEDQHVLMVRHGRGRDRGRWNLPGGKVAAGEGLIEGAEREAVEESGYQVRVQSLSGIYNYVSPSGKHCLRAVFFADVIDGEPSYDGDEIIDVRWFHFDQIERMQENRLCKPSVLRPIFMNLRQGKRHPLSLLTEMLPASIQA